MKNCNSPKNQTRRRILLVACTAALALAFTVSPPQPAQAQHITVPSVPNNVQVPTGAKVFLVGHAVGTQNYICLPTGSGVAYALFTPEATLFNDHGDQLITHFFSVNPNPIDDGAIRATWESSRDTSTVWAAVAPRTPENPLGGSSTDPAFVEPGAVAWLLLDVVGAMNGPTGSDRMSETTFVQRLNTHGGVAPSTDIGNRAFVPYRADYFFYHGPDQDK